MRLRVLDSMLRFRDGPHYLSMVLHAVRTDRLLISWFCPSTRIDLHISSGLLFSLRRGKPGEPDYCDAHVIGLDQEQARSHDDYTLYD